MIHSGHPGILPWTSPACAAAALAICKPQAGAVPLPAGRTFARAVGAVPGAVFAALDVRTGYLLATSSLNVRDDCLALLSRDAERVVYWLSVAPVPGTSHAVFSHAQTHGTYSLPCAAQSFGESLTLGERVTYYLQRQVTAAEAGFVLWFAGTGELLVPGGEPAALPLLALYGVFADDVEPLAEGLDRFAAEILAADGGAAMAADRASFTSASGVSAGAGRHAGRTAWLAGVLAEDARLESGKGPAWEASAQIQSSVGYVPTESLARWQDEDGSELEAVSNFSADLVGVEFDNLDTWENRWTEETGEPITSRSEYSPDFVPVEMVNT